MEAKDWHKPFALLVGIEVSILGSPFPLLGFSPLLHSLLSFLLDTCSGSGVVGVVLSHSA